MKLSKNSILLLGMVLITVIYSNSILDATLAPRFLLFALIMAINLVPHVG